MELEPTSWRQQAACRGLDPNMFYPDKESDTEQAKRVCSECIVRFACLEYALDHREKIGVWGGTSEADRRRIVRHRLTA